MICKTMIRATMIRKAYWSGIALIIVALAVATGCSNSPQSPPGTQIVTVSAEPPQQQTAVVNPTNTISNPPAPFQFASPLYALVTTGTNNTPVVGATVTFTAPAGGAGGSFNSVGGPAFATATTDTTGTAKSPTFYPNATVGPYVVIASTASSQSTGLFSMANTLLPAPVSISGGNTQSTSAGTQFQNALSVTVKDGSGNPVGAQLPVTFTAPSTGASGTFADSSSNATIALTNASGVATAAAFSANATDGGFNVTASVPDGDNATAIFKLWNTKTPATITPLAGSTPQNVAHGSPFPNPLAVTIVDSTSAPVVGAVVTFTAPALTNSSGTAQPSGTFADSGTITTTAITDGTGTATPATFTADSTPSPVGTPYNVSATVVVQSGTTLSTKFVLTND